MGTILLRTGSDGPLVDDKHDDWPVLNQEDPEGIRLSKYGLCVTRSAHMIQNTLNICLALTAWAVQTRGKSWNKLERPQEVIPVAIIIYYPIKTLTMILHRDSFLMGLSTIPYHTIIPKRQFFMALGFSWVSHMIHMCCWSPRYWVVDGNHHILSRFETAILFLREVGASRSTGMKRWRCLDSYVTIHHHVHKKKCQNLRVYLIFRHTHLEDGG